MKTIDRYIDVSLIENVLSQHEKLTMWLIRCIVLSKLWRARTRMTTDQHFISSIHKSVIKSITA